MNRIVFIYIIVALNCRIALCQSNTDYINSNLYLICDSLKNDLTNGSKYIGSRVNYIVIVKRADRNELDVIIEKIYQYSALKYYNIQSYVVRKNYLIFFTTDTSYIFGTTKAMPFSIADSMLYKQFLLYKWGDVILDHTKPLRIKIKEGVIIHSERTEQFDDRHYFIPPPEIKVRKW